MANELEIKSTYSAKGLVVGRCWGGGLAGYPTIEYNDFNSKENLINLVTIQLKENRSIDSGMGFERLVGVVLNIKETLKTELIGKEFIHEFMNEPEIILLPGISDDEHVNIMEIIDNYSLFN